MINQSAKDFDQAGERITADFRAMIADSEDLLKAAATVSSDSLTAARTKFEARVARAKAALADASQPVVDKTRAAAAAADGYVRDRTWSAIGVAAVIGALIGILAARR